MAFADFLIANDEATEEERLATRNLPSFQELHRKWPLTAFFQLR